MIIEKREQLENVAFRLPKEIRAKVEELAKVKQVKPSAVYRAIVVSFFNENRNRNG